MKSPKNDPSNFASLLNFCSQAVAFGPSRTFENPKYIWEFRALHNQKNSYLQTLLEEHLNF